MLVRQGHRIAEVTPHFSRVARQARPRIGFACAADRDDRAASGPAGPWGSDRAFRAPGDIADEIVETLGDYGAAEDEPSAALVDPMHDLVCDFRTRTDEIFPRRSHRKRDFAQRLVVLFGDLLDAVGVERNAFLPTSPSSGKGASRACCEKSS